MEVCGVQYVQVVKGLPYFRKRDCPSRPLKSPIPPPGEEGGSALEAEVRAVLAELEPARTLPGTLKAALRIFELKSPRFRRLRASTKRQYLYIINELIEDFGEQPVWAFNGSQILGLQSDWSERGYKAANDRMMILKFALTPSIIAGVFKSNPFDLIERVLPPSDRDEPHRLWPEWVINVAIEAAVEQRRFGLARAIAVGRYLGARREDLVRIPKSARQGGRIAFRTLKKGVPVDQEEDELLTGWLDAIPDHQPRSKWQRHMDRKKGVIQLPPSTLVFNTRGFAYTDDGLGHALAHLVHDLHEGGEIDSPDYDLHGLRHTRGVELALGGATDAEIAAALAHKSPSSAAIYRRQADRIRLSDNATAKIRALRERDRNALVKTECKPGENPAAAARQAAANDT